MTPSLTFTLSPGEAKLVTVLRENKENLSQGLVREWMILGAKKRLPLGIENSPCDFVLIAYSDQGAVEAGFKITRDIYDDAVLEDDWATRPKR